MSGQTIKIPNLRIAFNDFPAGINPHYKRMIPMVNRKLERSVPLLLHDGLDLKIQLHIRWKENCRGEKRRLCPYCCIGLATSSMGRVSYFDISMHLAFCMG